MRAGPQSKASKAASARQVTRQHGFDRGLQQPASSAAAQHSRTRVVKGEEAEEVELGAQAVHVTGDDLLAVAARHLA